MQGKGANSLREDSANPGFCLEYIVFTRRKTRIGLSKGCSYIEIKIGMQRGYPLGGFSHDKKLKIQNSDFEAQIIGYVMALLVPLSAVHVIWTILTE